MSTDAKLMTDFTQNRYVYDGEIRLIGITIFTDIENY